MTIRNLDFMFRPRSVALIGASNRPGSVGQTVAANLLEGGFSGPLWFINPRHDQVLGQRCYRALDALPAVPDLAVIAIPPAAITPLIDELGRAGCRAAIVLSAGIEGEREQRMLEAALPYNLRILGPNCIGLIAPALGLNASFAQAMANNGDLALISQSGALLTSILDWANGRDIGFSVMASLGNMADVDFGDMLDYLAGDVSSKAILIYMEGIRNAAKFMSAARRAARSKPVIVIKSGRHAAGARAAASHTGALAGSDKVYDAAFRRAGLLRVFDLEDLFVAAEMAERVGTLSGENLSILTNGGGAGVLAVDALADAGAAPAELSDQTRAALDAVLPPTWSKSNPIDIIGDAGPDRYRAALEILLRDPDTQAVLAMHCPVALASSEDAAGAVIAARDAVMADSQRRVPVIANWLGEQSAERARAMFAANGIPSFDTPGGAVRGFMSMVRYSRAQTELMRAPPALPEPLAFDAERVDGEIAAVLRTGRTMLSEPEAKTVLAAYGIPVVPTFTARTTGEVGALAQRILKDHPACVLKIISADLTHKSDVGGVRLDIETPSDATIAAEDMIAQITRSHPHARLEGISVQAMIRTRLSHELILGMTEDPTFGPVMLFGAGGTGVEAMADTAMALPPLDIKLALDLIRETRIYRLLKGYRDRPPVDLDAIALSLVRLSYLAAQHPQIRELDINPLLADEKGVIALDARVVVADHTERPRTAMAIRPYPREWEKHVDHEVLGRLLLRPIRPEDEDIYKAMIAQTTGEDLRLRFFSPHKHMSRNFLARLTQVDYAREIAFVALSEDGRTMLGVARFFADPDYRTAEYAVLVRSDLKGKGLGWRLMTHLIDYARAEGLERLHGSVLSENATMLAMCRDLGFSIAHDPDDPGLRRVELDVARTEALSAS